MDDVEQPAYGLEQHNHQVVYREIVNEACDVLEHVQHRCSLHNIFVRTLAINANRLNEIDLYGVAFKSYTHVALASSLWGMGS